MIAQSQKLAERLLASTNGNLEEALQVLRSAQRATAHAAYKPRNAQVIARATDVSKRYKIGRNQVDALNGVSVDIYKGEFVALTGPSGSGKSTLLQLLGGLDKVDSGSIEITGQTLAALNDRQLSRFRNRTIGFVFQFFYLQPFLDVATNIELPAMFARTKETVSHKRSEQLSAAVGLQERLRHLPRELSGGQMQRAAIARALQNNPPILLADEPTGNLDRKNALAIFELFRSICDQQGTTIVVVTHDPGLAAMADRIIELQDGKVV
jgi:ABC-type lipoprotein export system ATPase subunit